MMDDGEQSSSGDLASVAGLITDMSSGKSAACRILSLHLHTICIDSAVPFALEALVKVEAANRIWMGEVWACEPDEAGFRVELEATNSVNDVAGTEDLAARFFHRKRNESKSAAAEDAKATTGRTRH